MGKGAMFVCRSKKRLDHYVGYVEVYTDIMCKKKLYTKYTGIKRLTKTDAKDDAIRLADDIIRGEA